MDNNKDKNHNTGFEPEIDTWGTSVWIIDAPNIEYDQAEIKPWLIEQKKRNTIYVVLAVFLILLLVWLNKFITYIYSVESKIVKKEVQIRDLEPVVKKIRMTTSWLNYEQFKINSFLLENLFFVGDKNYEIIQKYYNFFNNPKVKASLWDFKLKTIAIQDWKRKEWEILHEKKIKIDWQFSSFNKDLKMMITFLNKMTPIIVLDNVTFSKWNNVVFIWRIYTVDKKLFNYDYWKNYKEINEILRLKEEYDKNLKILEKILADKDLGLKKLWIDKLYTCDQYKKIIEKQNLIKEDDVKVCYDVENLIKWLKKKIDTKFNNLVKKG